MIAPFKYYFSKERLFWEKRGALLNISRQKGSAYSREALSSIGALSSKYGIPLLIMYNALCRMPTTSLALLVRTYWYKTTHLLKKTLVILMTSSLTPSLFWDEGQPDNRQFSDLSFFRSYRAKIFTRGTSWKKDGNFHNFKLTTCLVCILHAGL